MSSPAIPPGLGPREAVLTGEHAVRTVRGCVLRFFLAGPGAAGPDAGWVPVTDRDFQYAYELSLFDPGGLDRGDLRPNARRARLALDALAGAGAFFWSDGADTAGVMTTDGRAPEECGLDLAALRRSAGGVS
ncbi:hypothetical protein [Streptomyces sp. NPDC057702]|uniref:hypothetical protein n=1 Tax=unclassified Streptomyces TaxID=2593676 RepID=UPI003678F786